MRTLLEPISIPKPRAAKPGQAFSPRQSWADRWGVLMTAQRVPSPGRQPLEDRERVLRDLAHAGRRLFSDRWDLFVANLSSAQVASLEEHRGEVDASLAEYGDELFDQIRKEEGQ